MPEIKKQSAFNKAMHNTNQWLLTYAKIMCNISNQKRLKVYRKLAALLRNRFSLMNALDMVYNGISEEGRKPNDPMAIALSMWGRSLQEGHPFSDCLKGILALHRPSVGRREGAASAAP